MLYVLFLTALSISAHATTFTPESYSLTNTTYTNEARIPKIIHQIWLGSPLPKKNKPLCDSWKQHHPEWQYIMWTDTAIDAFNLVNATRYKTAKNYGEKSDIARYELLERFGGLYVDTDFECLTSFDTLHHCCDFYAGYSDEKPLIIFNGLIGSSPGHPILKECIAQLQQPTVNITHDPISILTRSVPVMNSHCFWL